MTLVVNQGVTLTIPSSVTLTNKGTIENHGKIEGTVTGDTEALTSAVTFVTTPSYATVTVTGQTPASGKTYNLTDGNYSYTVSASGYVTVTGTFTVSGNAQTIPVILTAISTDSSSGGSSDPSYSPVLDVSNGGTIKVTPRTPSYGDKVTITPILIVAMKWTRSSSGIATATVWTSPPSATAPIPLSSPAPCDD